MPKIIAPLASNKIAGARPAEKMYKLQDGRGLAVWIHPTGRKSFVLQWYRPDKKLDTITLGQYPEMTLAEAREEAARVRDSVRQGKNPKTERARIRQEDVDNTFRTIASQWFERWKPKSDRYKKQTWNRLENDIFPTLGAINVCDITAQMVVEALRPMEKRGVLDSLGRMRGKIEEILGYAVASGLIPHNVATGTHRAFAPAEQGSFRALPPSALPEIVAATRNTRLYLQTRLLILWQLITVSRSKEAVAARWDEIDREEKLWRIPAGRMKAARPHDVHLSSLALELLDILRPLHPKAEFLFPGQKRKSHANVETVRMAFNRLGINTTAHGLRSIASTSMNEALDSDGRRMWDVDVIEAVLAHKEQNKVRAAYNRAEYTPHRRALLDWWSQKVIDAGFEWESALKK